jgi:hypothetical protein
MDTHPQDTVDRFADLTGDHQWIHVDGERAKASPFGGTIVHGYLTLGLVPRLSAGIYWVQVRPELRRQRSASRPRFRSAAGSGCAPGWRT